VSFEFAQQIFLILGGLGLFLLGMKIMSDGLQKIAGDRMREILKKSTSNRFMGLALGAGVTSVIQSSTATIVMVITFINANMMTLGQSIGVIMGAKIGTTLTAQMMSFKLDTFAPLIIFIGVVMYMFSKKRKVKNVGYVLLGLGILFFGISVMGAPFSEFANEPSFQSILFTFENPLLALLAGILFTAIIQSSTATIGIIIAMYSGGVDLSFQTAVFLVLGTNVGTCFTAVIASIPANRESKRAALFYVIFCVIGCIIFSALILLFPAILTWFQTTWVDEMRRIAMFHTIFNVASAAILIAFVKQLEALTYKIIPKLPGEDIASKSFVHLSANIEKDPDLAISQAKCEVLRIGKLAHDNLELAVETFYTNDMTKANQVVEQEEVINSLYDDIKNWIIKARSLDLTKENLERTAMMLRAISDIERIGDYADNLAENVLLNKQTTRLSKETMADLQRISQKTLNLIKAALEVYERDDEGKLSQIETWELEIIATFEESIENHIVRQKNGTIDPRSGVLFTDAAYYLKRCASHASNIAFSILDESEWCRYRKAGSGANFESTHYRSCPPKPTYMYK